MDTSIKGICGAGADSNRLRLTLPASLDTHPGCPPHNECTKRGLRAGSRDRPARYPMTGRQEEVGLVLTLTLKVAALISTLALARFICLKGDSIARLVPGGTRTEARQHVRNPRRFEDITKKARRIALGNFTPVCKSGRPSVVCFGGTNLTASRILRLKGFWRQARGRGGHTRKGIQTDAS
jgi:hypothetical protein